MKKIFLLLLILFNFSNLNAQKFKVIADGDKNPNHPMFAEWKEGEQYKGKSLYKAQKNIDKHLKRYKDFNSNFMISLDEECTNEVLKFVNELNEAKERQGSILQYDFIQCGLKLRRLTKKYNLKLAQQYAVASLLGNCYHLNAKYLLTYLYIDDISIMNKLKKDYLMFDSSNNIPFKIFKEKYE